MQSRPDDYVELVRENAVNVTRTLKQQEGKAIWLCGGGSLASTLLAEDLIDRLIVKLNPVIFGKRIPIFSGDCRQTVLELMDSKQYSSGHMVLYLSGEAMKR